MDNQKIGSFVAELRKEKGMTQKQLAEKLNVTDKAVSKWERGIGYPEITVIPLLADALGITTGELLLGERTPEAAKSEATEVKTAKTNMLVTDTIAFVQQAHEYKASKVSGIILSVLSAAFLIAVFVCMLCNYVISGTFDWSLYVVGGEAAAWLIIFPFLGMKRHRLAASLTALTVIILPLLLLIEHLCPAKNWVFPFAFWTAVISLASLWVIFLLFAKTRISRWYLAALAAILFGVILNFSINAMVVHYLNASAENISTYITALSFAFAAAVLAAIGFIKKRAK